MEQLLENTIKAFANELKSFNRNDVLVNLNRSLLVHLEENGKARLDSSADSKKMFQAAKQFLRETGASIFCVSNGVLEWDWKGQKCTSPILLCPASLEHNKIKNEYHVSFLADEAFLNPFLAIEFEKQFDFAWPELDFLQTDWNQVEQRLLQKGFEISVFHESHYGNFHHHRFNVLRDIEELQKKKSYNNALTAILQMEQSLPVPTSKWSNQLIYPSDVNQNEVLSAVKTQNLVVHGPPGTGKSQVLANLAAKCLNDSRKALVVSEKRVALEVIEKKLGVHQLNRFVFLPESTQSSSDLLKKLKETWLLLETNKFDKPFQLQLSREQKAALQHKLDVLSQEGNLGGIDYGNFVAQKNKYDLEEIEYIGNSAQISEFNENKEQIVRIYTKKVHLIVQSVPFQQIKTQSASKIARTFQTFQTDFRDLSDRFTLTNPNQLPTLMKKAAVAQRIINESKKGYALVLNPHSKERKQFERLRKKRITNLQALEKLKDQEKNWSIQPSLEEAMAILEALKNPSFLQRHSIKRRLKTLKSSAFLPNEEILNKWITYLNLKTKGLEIEHEFALLGIENETDLLWVRDLTLKITSDDWKEYEQAHSEENQKLADWNTKIHSFYSTSKSLIKRNEQRNFDEIFHHFNLYFSDFAERKNNLEKLSENMYRQIGSHDSAEELEKQILKSNWTDFLSQFPAFQDFKMNNFSKSIQEIIATEEKEFTDFSRLILHQQQSKFATLLNTLHTSTRKLSEEEKSRRAKLKKGRSLLIKEFGKTRSHPTIRELLVSDAAEWIYTLLPIWLVSPVQCANYFPLKKELFDIALFDESTQIPLVNSLGSIFRSKQIVVFGDEEQMSPIQFFTSGNSEPIDLLHQAKFTWQKIMLKHHYRSYHPELISFSNRYFYEDKLIPYPSPNSDEKHIVKTYLPEGKFINRTNPEEAENLAKKIDIALQKPESIGVVTFNENQLALTYSLLSSEAQNLLDERTENGTCFFKTIENVQGEECDHLLISLGYAKNEDGKLALNFGPLNRKSGRRRLNVLFSRAKKSIDFICSIEANDLSISENDSLNLLRKYFIQSTEKSEHRMVDFPYGLRPKISTDLSGHKTVSFHSIYRSIKTSEELVTFYSVLKDRGWGVKFE